MSYDDAYLLVIPIVLTLSVYAIYAGLKLWERYKLFLDYVEKNPSPTAALEYMGLKQIKEKIYIKDIFNEQINKCTPTDDLFHNNVNDLAKLLPISSYEKVMEKRKEVDPDEEDDLMFFQLIMEEAENSGLIKNEEKTENE